MVATFNGWEDMAEQEREVLERWEEEAMGNFGIGRAVDRGSHCEGAKRPKQSRGRPRDRHAASGVSR